MPRQSVHTHLDHLPNGGVPHLYAVRFASGLVKIGATRCPRERAVNLQWAHGEQIVESAAVPVPEGVDMFVFEGAAIRRAKLLAQSVNGREYFTGLSFADALSAIEPVAAKPVEEAQES